MELNLLILAIYILCVTYVFYQVAQSLDNHISVSVNQASIEKELKDKQIQDVVALSFAVPGMCPIDEFKDIGIKIQNKSPTRSLAINWQQSTISTLQGNSRRVIREVPGMKIDLSQPQSFTSVGPSQSVSEKITTESTLAKGEEGGFLVAGPLFSVPEVKSLPPEGGTFTLQLSIQVSEPGVKAGKGPIAVVDCEFDIKKTSRARVARW